MAEWKEPTVSDEDRLPWLETASDDQREGPSIGRVLWLVLAGLAVIAVAIFGIHWMGKRRLADGGGAVIAAPDGDYKVKPDDAGGMNVTGEGNSAIATSDGQGSGNASINVNATPEQPVDGKHVANGGPASGGASKTIAPIPPSQGKLAAGAANAVAAKGGGGGSLVQLGSFPDEAAANAAWAAAGKRFGYLAALGKSVQKADVGGRTVYRLRVNAGSAGAASELCGKLKVAGEACFVPKD